MLSNEVASSAASGGITSVWGGLRAAPHSYVSHQTLRPEVLEPVVPIQEGLPRPEEMLRPMPTETKGKRLTVVSAAFIALSTIPIFYSSPASAINDTGARPPSGCLFSSPPPYSLLHPSDRLNRIVPDHVLNHIRNRHLMPNVGDQCVRRENAGTFGIDVDAGNEFLHAVIEQLWEDCQTDPWLRDGRRGEILLDVTCPDEYSRWMAGGNIGWDSLQRPTNRIRFAYQLTANGAELITAFPVARYNP